MQKKNTGKGLAALQGAKDKAKTVAAQTEESLKEESKTEVKKQTKQEKAKQDKGRYMRLDLCPDFCGDLKAYVTQKAGDETSRRGKTVSSTRIIQEIIYNDMLTSGAKGKTKSKREVLADKLYNLSDKDIAAIECVVDAFITKAKYEK